MKGFAIVQVLSNKQFNRPFGALGQVAMSLAH